MSNSNVGQDKSTQVRVRLTDVELRDFRIALALHSETAQDVLHRAVVEYIQKTPLPDDTMLGKSK